MHNPIPFHPSFPSLNYARWNKSPLPSTHGIQKYRKHFRTTMKKCTHIFLIHNSNGTRSMWWSRVEQFYTLFYSNVIARDRFFHIRFENGDDPAKRDDPVYDRVWKIRKDYSLWTKTFCEISHSREAYNITYYNERVDMDQAYPEEEGWIFWKTSIRLKPQGPEVEEDRSKPGKGPRWRKQENATKREVGRATESDRDASHMSYVPNGTKGYTTTTITTTTTTSTTIIEQKVLLWTKWSCFTKKE